MNQEKKGIRSIFDLFRTHKPIPAVPISTAIPRYSKINDRIMKAEEKRLRKQQRNIKNAQKHTS